MERERESGKNCCPIHFDIRFLCGSLSSLISSQVPSSFLVTSFGSASFLSITDLLCPIDQPWSESSSARPVFVVSAALPEEFVQPTFLSIEDYIDCSRREEQSHALIRLLISLWAWAKPICKTAKMDRRKKFLFSFPLLLPIHLENFNQALFWRRLGLPIRGHMVNRIPALRT